ncbi:MAG: type II toxin-antitoxin system VapC family toxin [Cyclobacteriaceae bacterium]
MKSGVLLDTQVFIWSQFDEKKLSEKTIELLLSSSTIKFLSTASVWEIAIKQSLGKLSFDFEWEYVIKNLSLEIINITIPQIERSRDLPFIHSDPFDRLLIAQSMIEGIPLVTSDHHIHQYDFAFIKA